MAKAAVFVVQRNIARGAQDRLAQPAQAEQQEQNTDGELQHIERHAVEQGAQRNDDDGEHQKPGNGAEARRPPAAHNNDGKHDGQRLDRLDQRGEKRRNDRRSGVQTTDHCAPPMLGLTARP